MKRLAGEMDALRRCREWLERLERRETVVVNLRPETDPETEYVAFDRPLDHGLLAHKHVWVGAGSPSHMAVLSSSDLVRLAKAQPMDAVEAAT